MRTARAGFGIYKRDAWVSPVSKEPAFLAAVAFSPDGRFLAVGGSGGFVTLFPISDLDQPMRLTGHTDRIRSLAFSRQGDLLASGAEDNDICLWKPSDWNHWQRSLVIPVQ